MTPIAYITTARIPSERAHAIQIVKTCEALGRAGTPLTLIAPLRKDRTGEDPFLYHHLAPTFEFRYLPTIDTVSKGWFGFWFHQFYFSVIAALWLRKSRFKGVVYGRDEALLWVMRWFGFTVVWESHQGSRNFFARRLLRKRTLMVVISDGLRKFYLKRKASLEHIGVAHDGIDLASFTNPISKGEARKELGLPERGAVAMYIGSLEEWKGYRTFLRTAKLLKGKCTVAVIGGTDAKIAALSREYPDALFLGPRPYDELPRHQQAADVLVVPNTAKSLLSAKFTSPLKVFAHMASGIPIVACAVPSIKEVLSEEMAILVTPDNPEAMKKGIEEALKASSRKKAILAARAVSSYTWDERAHHIIEFLTEHTDEKTYPTEA